MSRRVGRTAVVVTPGVVPAAGRRVTALWRVAVRANGDEAEPLRARLLGRAPAGLEEVADGSGVELAMYVAAEQLESVLGWLPQATATPVEAGWEDAWRDFHRPVVVEGLWLGPPWEQAPDPMRSVVIDPGRAFGTGAHPTTQLCVAFLASTTERGRLLDIGCGSGVLAIVAARLGFEPVHAIDVDPVAVEATRANAAANGVQIEASVVDALEGPLPRVDVAVANVLLGPVERILARLEAPMAITSGYVLADTLEPPGWSRVERRDLDGWAADLLVRTS